MPAVRCMLLLSFLTTAMAYTPSSVLAADLPDEIERQIDEQTENLPESVRERIREKLKERAAEKIAQMKESAGGEPSASASEKGGSKEASKDSSDGEKKAAAPKKPPVPPMSAESRKLRSEMELYDTKFKHKLFEYRKELEAQLLMLEKTKLDRKIESERLASTKAATLRERDRLKLDLEIAKLHREFEKNRIEEELTKLLAEKKTIETELEVESAREMLENRVLGEEQYPDEPFKDGILTISPRRIEFNGPIVAGAADYVCQRLDYYNNQSDKPIFLVIDNSPGGSAIEGMQILQGIRESKAPVHVVVKRFAASMAAIITTLSDHSYCYPNSIILHHQASSALVGNGRSMEDQKKMFDQISTRLIGAVAEKVGMTEKEFVDAMYENRVSGDWDLFGDQAVENKWVGNLVDLVREESIRRRPTGMRPMPMRMIRAGAEQTQTEATGYLERYEAPLAEQVDAQGRTFVRLPRMSPIDAWLIYNPGEYYR